METFGGKTLYKLSDAQKLLRWSEAFSIEKRKVKENNILSYSVKAPYDTEHTAEQIADAFEGALNEVIKNNDSLRIHIIKTSKGLRQYIEDHTPRSFERENIDGETGFDDVLANTGKYKVDWLDDHLLFAKIFILNSHQAAMLIRIHHSVFDGYSTKLFFEQFLDAYKAILNGETPTEPKKLYSITEYFKENDEYLHSPAYKADRKFWYDKYNHQRHYSFPAGYRSEFGDCSSSEILLEGEIYENICELASQCNCSLQSALMSLAAITTYVITGKDNFCLYSLTHGRRKFTSKKTIGCMMNTVPIFYDIADKDKPVNEFIRESYLDFMDTLTHARLSMGDQVPMSYKEPIKHFLNFNHGWLLFSTMDYESVKENAALEITDLPSLNQAHQFYASILEVPGEHVRINFQYQIHKFKREKIEKILNVFCKVCTEAARNSNVTVSEINNALSGKKKG